VLKAGASISVTGTKDVDWTEVGNQRSQHQGGQRPRKVGKGGEKKAQREGILEAETRQRGRPRGGGAYIVDMETREKL